ncbi:thermonuclease family protein (plasmid) [Bradyrhizobium sp. ISRA443]|uniref:thermonuclease family protein n=1 Tax=unclassified Bradyrhizobium TaxID=2631580 RepID=UPI0024786B5A|nr:MULTISPECIES: thermonuclease family protein [unclassified Bradyrhizobium]WGR90719.1 thermonuclease family protein [Bradyrhizobium sp. ISRA435]WGS03151.1 thermonuclease family protein [Bradyrhizobium sp. ISRA436]WGS10055.1 thermonuclease family protein [Bradyrhizobium sp. ISRA437]WGS16940.1 thermonuclease family protein [Bradyrhizobium sp. ISRA443]
MKKGSNGTLRDYRRRPTGAQLALVIAIVVLAAYFAVDRYRIIDQLRSPTTRAQEDTVAATFPFCGEGGRITCVVDGDTFWLEGAKIRIADIDAPELSPPRCEAERQKGEAAKYRLRELLSAGPFSLVSGARDVDRYGRKLRTVTRQGRSIGETLVQEGLARRWDGSRHPWCN